jgi:uncharacterized protein
MKMSETKDGIVIEVFVKPNSQKFEATVEDDEVIVRCKEEPVKGKVNKEIIKELSKLFHSRVEIVSGATSKQKVLLVRGAKKNEIERLLK